MKKRYTFLLIIIVLLLVMILVIPAPRFIIKTAVKEHELPSDAAFIVCELAQVTGFDWFVVSVNGKEERGFYCNIVGPTPLDLGLKYDFLTSSNSYVFYVTDVREYYAIEIDGMALEYTVSGWDILYPVRREAMITFLKPPEYVLKSDLNRKQGTGHTGDGSVCYRLLRSLST